MDRLLHGVGGYVTLEVRDGDGALADPDTAAMTARVLTGNGEVHVATAAATRDSRGVYSLLITGSQADPYDLYTVEWFGTIGGNDVTFRTIVEVVGDYVCTVQNIRDYDRDITEARYAASVVREVRDLVTERMEAPGTTPYSLRGRRETLTGNGRSSIMLAATNVREIVSLAVNGTARTDYTFTETGIVSLARSSFPVGAVVTVHYVCGYLEVPEPVRRAACMLAVEYLVRSAIPQRATSQATDVGSFRLTVAGRDGWTGVPEVDEIIRQYGVPLPGWAR